MKLNAADIGVLCSELHVELMGGVVQKVWDGRPGEILLRVRAPGNTHLVLFAAGSIDARLHLMADREERRDAPTAFCFLARKHVMGLRVLSVRQVSHDRLVEVRMGHRDTVAVTLVAELTGRHGNLFLVDLDGKILGSIRANVSRRRSLSAGQPYVRPGPPAQADVRAAQLIDDGSASSRVALEVGRAIRERAAKARLVAAGREVRTALRRARRRLDKVDADRARADGAEGLRRRGELLQSAYGRVERGARSVVVADYYEPGAPDVEVPLDPALSLNDNVQRIFRKAKRLAAARETIQRRFDETAAVVARLERATASLGALTLDSPEGAVDEVMGPLRGDRLVPRERPRGAPKRDGERLPYHRFTSAKGYPILVGRSAKDNDKLTFKVARGNDLWLHVDGASGSHVVVRLPKRAEVDRESLLDAATLAAFYSRLKRDTTVDVRYARQAEVRKPKGAPPGAVNVVRSKSVAVRIEQGRLDRLMATREQV